MAAGAMAENEAVTVEVMAVEAEADTTSLDGTWWWQPQISGPSDPLSHHQHRE